MLTAAARQGNPLRRLLQLGQTGTYALTPAGKRREQGYTRLDGLPAAFLPRAYARRTQDVALLGCVEHALLAIIATFDSPVWSSEIAKEYEGRSGFALGTNQLYLTLSRLATRQYVTGRFREKAQCQTGKARKYYELTNAGPAALLRAQRIYARIVLGAT